MEKFRFNGDVTFEDVLVYYPLVREDAPVWKQTCPFCGEFGGVHEVGDTYVCHWCHANWFEHDTETERQIQVIHLNGGKMPVLGEGDMPLVERVIHTEEDFICGAEINMQTKTITFFPGGLDDDERASGF